MNSDNQAMNRVFGNCLVRLRKGRGRSQKFIAIEAGLDASYLAGIELGRRPPPRQPVLEKILTALCATPAERQELKRAIGIAKLVRIAANELEPDYGQSLIQIATAMQYCSREERKALAVIALGFEQRRTANTEGIIM